MTSNLSSYLAESRDQKRKDQAAAAAIRQANLDAAHARQLQDQAAADQRAAERRAERKADWKARRAALPELGMSALWATLIVLPIALAWNAQARFAAEALKLTVPFNHGFPAVIEVAAWLCAFEAHRRGRDNRPVGSLRMWMWVLAGIAAVINAAHGIEDTGVSAGLALGALSLIGVLLHSIRQALDHAAATGGRRALGLAVWRRIRYPRLSLDALSLRAARGLDVDTAWSLAWEHRYGVGPDASARDRELAELILDREMDELRTAAADGELTIVDGRVQRGWAPDVRAYVDAERDAALARANAAAADAERIVQEAHDVVLSAGMFFGRDAITGPQATRTDAGELSPRASELLPALQDAITSGQLTPAPSVKKIQTWVREERHEGLGVPTAQELRDALAAEVPNVQPITRDQNVA